MTQTERSSGAAPGGGERVRLASPEERRYWSGRLGVAETELAAIVAQVGDEPAAVEEYVRGASSPH